MHRCKSERCVSCTRRKSEGEGLVATSAWEKNLLSTASREYRDWLRWPRVSPLPMVSGRKSEGVCLTCTGASRRAGV